MSLVCSAFEGGSNYWCKIKGYVRPENAKAPTREWYGLKLARFPHIWLPFSDGGGVECIEDCGEGGEPVEHLLNRAAIERGLKLMAEKQGRHWGNFLSGNDDAITGDVFLQMCILGEVKYG